MQTKNINLNHAQQNEDKNCDIQVSRNDTISGAVKQPVGKEKK